MEYILCAAIWFEDGEDYNLQCVDGKTGYVVCGRSHADIFYAMSIVDKKKRYKNLLQTQGFMTSKNRFVNRLEAAEIALNANQVKGGVNKILGLFSEELY